MNSKTAVLSDEQIDLFDLSNRAQFLTERMDEAGTDEQNVSADEASLIEKRLTRWTQTAAQSKTDLFLKRLNWAELDENSARRLLADSNFYPGSNISDWTKLFESCLETLVTFSTDVLDADILKNLTEQVPFWELCYPFAHHGRKLLDELIASDDSGVFEYNAIAPSVLDQFQADLLNQLVDYMAPCLYEGFKEYRPSGINLLNTLMQESVFIAQKDRYYQVFVAERKANGLSAFFTKYAALGRVVTLRISYWLETTFEFLTRLQQDLPAIQTKFGSGYQKVIKVAPNLSDYHNTGRTVIAVHFESGEKLVYKPKNGGVEAAYYNFLAWCNSNIQSENKPFHSSKILDLDSHCWVEYVEHTSCAEPDDIARFYERSGMLLAAIYLLGGVDCHYENIIACGAYPVLVDTETLLHPHVNKAILGQGEKANAFQEIDDHFWDSVLRTGMLPRWEFGKDPKLSIDVSGFGSEDHGQKRTQRLEWTGINTDSVSRRYKEYERVQKQNMPLLKGEPVSFQPYTEHIIAGFEQFYNFICDRRVVLEKENVLAGFKDQKIRYVYRSTNIYSSILNKALLPDALQSGIDFSIEIDALSIAYVTEKEFPQSWPILEEEQADMLNLDIPYFSCSTSSATLNLKSGKAIPQFFKSTSFDDLMERVESMTPEKLTQQVTIIRGAFHARFSQNYERLEALKYQEKLAIKTDAISKFQPNELLAEAIRIGDAIENTAIVGPGGSLNWIGLAHFPEADRYQLQPLDNSMYSGRCGIALFLATLYKVSGIVKYKTLALNSLVPLRAQIQIAEETERDEFARVLRIGAACGIGSFIYAFTRIADLLDEPELLNDAYTASTFLAKKVIEEDQCLDIISGSSGAILGLLALYKATKNAEVLEKATWCGTHLVKHISVYNGHEAWLTFEDTPLCGFAHGAAGIAYALIRLYAVTGDAALLDAAQKGIAFEDAMYSASQKNWPDLRSFSFQDGTYGFTTTWCHGAPGIGLARLGTLERNVSPNIRDHIDAAIDCTMEFGTNHPDYLCCGNFGRIEFLLEASRKLNRPELGDHVELITAQVLNQAAQEGSYQLFCNTPSTAFKPGLFLGMSGIGYQLLRLYSSNVPSVLLWGS